MEYRNDRVGNHTITLVFFERSTGFGKSSNNFRFSAAAAEFSMILRDSEFKGDADLKSVMDLAKHAKGDDQYGYRAEFLTLVERADVLDNNK